jgi:hypothetical protein
LPQKAQFDNLSHTISNPFETISSLFANVPLINVATKDIMLQVPMLTADEITRYASYLEIRLQRNQEILNEWNAKLGQII